MIEEKARSESSGKELHEEQEDLLRAGSASGRLLLINSVCGIGSTGRIVCDLADEYRLNGWQVRIAFGRGAIPKTEQETNRAVRIGTDADVRLHGLLTRFFDLHGFGSKRATQKFLAWASEYDPDVLWLHNIHGYYIHIGELFRWIKSRPQMEVRWTLHDCWTFTGHCAHFTATGCGKWKTAAAGCRGDCPEKHSYPACRLFSRSRKNFETKRALFCGIPKLTLYTPSVWLSEMVKQSFLKDYPVEVKSTVIDRTVFRPTEGFNPSVYGLEGKKIILGVAGTWTKRKGWDDFLALAKLLPDEYRIVLVGVSAKQKQALAQRGNILGIERTESKRELAAIYTAAAFFVNPTYEDTYPTVNLEAGACGTRVIAYDVGGCRETVGENGQLVPVGDVERVAKIIREDGWQEWGWILDG